MLGTIIGDIVGSVYEFNNIKTTQFEFYSKDCSYTDDTIMTVAVADYLMTDSTYHQTLENNLVGFAEMYPYPKGGYGGRFRKWLFHPEELNADGSKERHPINSYGNGSAMRVSSVGWLYNTLEEVERMAKFTAEITHNHPEGIKGALATAVAIMMARHGQTKEEIRSFIEQRYGYDLHRTCDDIRPTYTFDESCQGTVPEAIIAFLDSQDFEHAIRLAISLGGDSDTLACITGGIAEAFYKEIPDWIRQGAYAVLPDQFKHIIERLYKTSRRLTTGQSGQQNNPEEVLNIEDMNEVPTVYQPEEILLNNDNYCQAILDSDYFEEYIQTLADRNPYYLRVGIAVKAGRFIMDLLRTAEAANLSFESQLSSEGTTFDAYRKEHESECLIYREGFFRDFEMPDEQQAVPLVKIKDLIGELSDRQQKRYEEKTNPMDEAEVKEYIHRMREFKDLMGWKNIHKQDKSYVKFVQS